MTETEHAEATVSTLRKTIGELEAENASAERRGFERAWSTALRFREELEEAAGIRPLEAYTAADLISRLKEIGAGAERAGWFRCLKTFQRVMEEMGTLGFSGNAIAATIATFPIPKSAVSPEDLADAIQELPMIIEARTFLASQQSQNGEGWEPKEEA